MSSLDVHSFGEGFSILLKKYRKELRGWTQKELANKSGLKIRTIQDLETAQKAVLDHDTIAKLADTFDLQGSSKEAFFASAGLAVVMPPFDEIEWGKVIFEFHKSMEFPAFVGDALMQVHSVNSYLLELLEINLDALANLISTRGGLNAMYFFFDPAFNTRRLYGQTWKSYVTTNVWFLRHMSRPHTYEARFQKLLSELHQFEKFTELWDETKDMRMPLPPYLGVVQHHKYGSIQYWHSTSVKPNTSGEEMSFLFYHPADPQSEQAFTQLRVDVPKVVYQTSNARGKGLVRLL
jgi:transcriptional regulator with XRE-family HTH domain